MGVGGGQHQGAQAGEIEPHGELPADDAAVLPGAAARDDLYATDLVRIGGVYKVLQSVEGGLRGFAVQVQRAGGGELAAAQAVPGGAIQAGGLEPGDQGWWGLGSGAGFWRCWRLGG